MYNWPTKFDMKIIVLSFIFTFRKIHYYDI